MTNRYEDAFDDLIIIKPHLKGMGGHIASGELGVTTKIHFDTIISALQLAQEAEQLRLKLSETAIHLAARNSEIEQLRKERDELARAIIKIHEDQEGDYDFLKFISHPQYILAKKVAGE